MTAQQNNATNTPANSTASASHTHAITINNTPANITGSGYSNGGYNNNGNWVSGNLTWVSGGSNLQYNTVPATTSWVSYTPIDNKKLKCDCPDRESCKKLGHTVFCQKKWFVTYILDGDMGFQREVDLWDDIFTNALSYTKVLNKIVIYGNGKKVEDAHHYHESLEPVPIMYNEERYDYKSLMAIEML